MYSFTYSGTNETVTVKAGQGILKSIVVGTTSASAIEVYDGTDGGSENAKLAELKASVAEGTYEFDCVFAKGLIVWNPGRSKITIVWR
jgi:hypothetical protein